ncbi:MAG: PEP-CTERM sorting domain-containing protein [Planctomycetales bacterium]|nr:PEP-CTERM sorting domain-containing protein [Planctomycetales bacterium]
MKISKTLLAVTTCLLLIADSAQAYLGGFESGDGYHTGSPLGSNLGARDVTRYNAGEYGLNNGGPGGGPALIPVDTGLWRVIAGGRLLNQPSDYYVIQHPAPVGHSSPNVLGMTTGNSTPYVGVDTEYQYDFDSRDFDGNVPSSLSNSVVDAEFYWCPSNTGVGGFSSTLTDPGATIQIQDSAGTNFFEIGSYGAAESIAYRLLGGTWISAGFNSSGDFDRINLTFDLLNDTVSFSFFQTIGATNNVVLTNAALGTNMDYLGHLALTMKAENSKNYLDDVDFRVNQANVPEPTSAVLLLAGLVGALALRRRSC